MKNIFTIILLLILSLTNQISYSQIVGNDLFMKGLYTELGICKKGAFGSGDNAPAGYHPRTLSAFEATNHLGFVCDVDMDGWTVGVPNYFGDYFTPGGAQEGWDIQLNNNWMWPDDPAGERWAKMWRHPWDGGAATPTIVPVTAVSYLISGNNTDYYISGRNKIAVWEGDMGSAATTYHIGIRQEVILDTIKRYFVVKVTFKAKSVFFGSPTFYYDRTVDPDNDRAFAATFSTNNTVVHQPDIANNKCLVNARGTHFPEKNYLGLGTLDCRAKAYITNVDVRPAIIKSIYETGAGATTAEGSSIVGDRGIGIIFKIPPMAYGDSTTISYAYVLNEGELDEALALTAPSIGVDGDTYIDGDTLSLCSLDTTHLTLLNSNGLNWGEWTKDGIATGVSGTSIDIIPESEPYTLSIIGNSVACMSDTFRLVVVPAIKYHTLDIVICSGEVFIFGDHAYAHSILNVHDTVTTVSECDSIITLNLTVNPVDTTIVDTVICSGNTLDFHGTSYSSAGTYYHYDTIGIECDTIYKLNLMISPIITFEQNLTICAGDSYEGYTTAGIYHDTFSTATGCDSVRTLTLAIQNHITTITEQICNGETYLGYNSTGIYHDTFTSALGCDSIRILDLTVHNATINNITASICMGENISGYTNTGIYHDTFTSTLTGCDSIRIIDLTVDPVIVNNIAMSICVGTSYLGYTAAGIYHDTFAATSGCDSVRILDLEIIESLTTNITEDICIGESFLGYTSTGTYQDTFAAASGCDSVRILNLVVHPIPTTTINIAICNGTAYEGYTATGIYTDTFTSIWDCDSIRVINLTVNPSYNFSNNETICEGETFAGYATEGTYIDTFSTINGCDSIRTLLLTVNPRVYTNIVDTICQGASAHGYTSTGIYIDTFSGANSCDSIVTLNLTVMPTYANTHSLVICNNQLPYTYMGISIPVGTGSTAAYAALAFETIYGCDSIVTINLTINDTSRTDIDTLVCHDASFIWNGVNINATGTYTYTTNNVTECDSTVVMSVTFMPAPIIVDSNIKACGEAIYAGNTFYNDTQFVDTFRNMISCDSLYRSVKIDILNVAYDTLVRELCKGENYDFNGTNYSTTGQYTQSYLNHNGCDSFITLDLTVHEIPVVKLDFENFNEDNLICVGDTILLIGSGAQQYVYYNQYGDPIQDQQNPLIRIYANENQFFVIGTDENGCFLKTQITILAENCCDIMIPNAFSPNSDGLNDQFGIVSLGNPMDFTMQIFDRWGKRVFISYNPNTKWDGTFEGKIMDAGVYFYTVNAKCYDGTPFNKKGDIHLVK